MPEGTPDIDVMEAGWAYVDSQKVVYGAIDGSDSNGNVFKDSEENADGTTYYLDPAAAYPLSIKGTGHVAIQTSAGNLSDVLAIDEDDESITTSGKPDDLEFPYGAFSFTIVGLDPGASATVTIAFPNAVPAGSRYYKISQFCQPCFEQQGNVAIPAF